MLGWCFACIAAAAAAGKAPPLKNLVRCDALGARKLIRGSLPVLLKVDMPRGSMTPDVAERDADWVRFALRAAGTPVVVADLELALSEMGQADRALAADLGISNFGHIPRVVFYAPNTTSLKQHSHELKDQLSYKALAKFAEARGLRLQAPPATALRPSRLNVVRADPIALAKLADAGRPMLVRVNWSPVPDAQDDDGSAFFRIANSALDTAVLFVNLTVSQQTADNVTEALKRDQELRSFSQLPAYWAYRSGEGPRVMAGDVSDDALRTFVREELGVEVSREQFGGDLAAFGAAVSGTCAAEECSDMGAEVRRLAAGAAKWEREAAGFYEEAVRAHAPGGAVDQDSVRSEREKLRKRAASAWVPAAARRRALRRLAVLSSFPPSE